MLEDVLKDREVVEELLEMVESGVQIPGASELGIRPDAIRRALDRPARGAVDRPAMRGIVEGLEGLEGAVAEGVPPGEPLPGPPGVPGPPGPDGLEAIIRLRGRPSLLVRNKTFDLPDSRTWRRRLLPNKSQIESVIASVGRVELIEHPSYDWVGTAWVVGERTVVTNRHVAATFAQRENGGFGFVRNFDNKRVGATVDFAEEFRTGLIEEIEVEKILFVADEGTGNPDIALLRLAPSNNIPDPVPLAADGPSSELFVAVVGYPARDSRNERDAMVRIFGDIYDVKRLAPGQVTLALDADSFFTHDCSTLGGNSGSVVMDIESGTAVGLHFAGRYRKSNYAVKASEVREAMSAMDVIVPVPIPVVDEERPEASGVRDPSFYEGRTGYAEAFLGPDHPVALPKLGPWEDDVAPVADAGDEQPQVANYTHFSLAVCKSRRLPLFTAVNIDGMEARRVPRRGDRWFLDGRIPLDFQTGNEAYRSNDLDRGHMVRRLDPVWGDRESAETANEDTFHYVNACPQHKDLNRATWVGLEDYILDNADARDLKVSVLTGPVFGENDAPYRGIRLPREYWKVAALVNQETGELSSTGYLLSQAGMVDDLSEFVFGKYETYQVPIARIEKLTGLDFGELRGHDPIAGEEELEIIGAPSTRMIRGPADIVFS